jgi:hypothetical protein
MWARRGKYHLARNNQPDNAHDKKIWRENKEAGRCRLSMMEQKIKKDDKARAKRRCGELLIDWAYSAYNRRVPVRQAQSAFPPGPASWHLEFRRLQIICKGRGPSYRFKLWRA